MLTRLGVALSKDAGFLVNNWMCGRELAGYRPGQAPEIRPTRSRHSPIVEYLSPNLQASELRQSQRVNSELTR